MIRFLGITPQKRPDPRDTRGPKAANCRLFKGFVAGHGMIRVGVKRKFNRVWAAAAIGFAVVLGSIPTSALAADDDEESALPDVKLLRGIMNGLGLKRDGEAIDYRERSP